jgi:hypothetical protein
MLRLPPALLGGLTQPSNSLVVLAGMAVLILEPVVVAGAVPQGPMVRGALAGQIVLRQPQLVAAAAAVTVVEQGRVRIKRLVQRAQVLVLAARAVFLFQVLAHLVARAGRAQTQPRPMYFRVAVAAVLAMVPALRSEAAVACMVLAVAVPQRLLPPLEALDQSVCWLLRTHRYCQRQ